jgi:hypothetical protein
MSINSAQRGGAANYWFQAKETICDASNVEAKICTEEQLGSFVLTSNATDVSLNPILSKAIHLNNPDAVRYPVRKTGFYCVSTYAYSGQEYNAVVTFRNSYGELPAAQIAKLPFYGALTIVYAVIGMYVSWKLDGFSQSSGTCLRQVLDFGPSFTCRTVMTFVRLRVSFSRYECHANTA